MPKQQKGPDDDRAARTARAQRLRREIIDLAHTPGAIDESGGAPPPAPTPENPRDFIQRRMRELDSSKKKK